MRLFKKFKQIYKIVLFRPFQITRPFFDFNKERILERNLKKHKDTQIIIKKYIVFFTKYNNEWKDHEFWRQKYQKK